MARRDTRKDKIPGFFLGGMFSGSGGQSQTQNSLSGSNTISGPVPGSPYEVFQNEQLAKIGELSDRPFQWYDVNKFGPMANETQGRGWNMLEQAGSSWQPYFNQASGVLDKANAIDPSVAFNKALTGPTALEAADPWTQKAGQSWGDVSSSYMNPYINDVIKNANDLQSKNFLENVMPGISNTFVASGGGLGGKNYGKDMNWALTNFNDSLNRTNTSALSDEWNKAAGIFGTDASRWAGLSNTVGNQATADRAGFTNLGSAQTGQIGALTGLGGQYGNLGTGALQNSLAGADATLRSGNERQAIDNWKNQFNYEQFQKEQEYPYKTAAFAANTANQYTWPMRSNTQGWNQTTQTGSSSSAGSPFGSILGGLSAVGSLGKQFGGMFGGMGGGGAGLPSVPTDAGTWGGALPTVGSGELYKRGGSVRGYFAGGKVTPEARRAVHAHERTMHKGQPLTKMQRGGPVRRYAFGGGVGGMFGGMGGGGMDSGMGGLPWVSLLNSGMSLGKHIIGGPNQMEVQPGSYPYDPASGIWDAIDPDKVTNNQDQLIGGDIGRGVGSVVGTFFGPFAPAFTEGFGRLGTGIGALTSGKGFGAMAESLAEGTPFDLLFSRGGRVPRRARGGYLGLDAPSTPPVVSNPGYFKWMDSQAFASGGHVPVVRAQRASNDRRLSALRTREKAGPRGVSRQLAFPSPALPSRPGFFS